MNNLQWAVGTICAIVIAGILVGFYDGMKQQSQVSQSPDVQKSEVKFVLNKIRSESIKYYSNNSESYADMCVELSKMDLKPIDATDLINPEQVVSDARCFASKEKFAVSTGVGGEHYCVAAKPESLIPNNVQSGKVADENLISCVNSTSSTSSTKQID
jgi:hypothetical protein